MVKKKDKKWKCLVFSWSLLIIVLVLNFTRDYFGMTHKFWHLGLHSLIIIFFMGSLLFSLKLSEKAMKYVVFGATIGVITELIYFLTHIFEEYYFIAYHFAPAIAGVLAIFLIMLGFEEEIR